MKTATWFALWAATGAAAALGVLTLLTIGLFVLPAALVLAAVLAWRAPHRLAGPGIVTGLGMPLLYVAYLNRAGPGTICTTYAGGGTCTQEMSPWPWVTAGLVLALAGIVLWLTASRRRRRTRPGQ